MERRQHRIVVIGVRGIGRIWRRFRLHAGLGAPAPVDPGQTSSPPDGHPRAPVGRPWWPRRHPRHQGKGLIPMIFKRAVQRYGRTPEPETQFQRAGQLWHERIGSGRVPARKWRLMAFGCLGLTTILSGGLLWQSLQSRVVPYVVEVDRLGEARAVSPADTAYQPTDPQIAWFLSRFIAAVRGRSLDPVLMRQNWPAASDFTPTPRPGHRK